MIKIIEIVKETGVDPEVSATPQNTIELGRAIYPTPIKTIVLQLAESSFSIDYFVNKQPKQYHPYNGTSTDLNLPPGY